MQPLYCKYILYVLTGFIHSSTAFYSHFILVIFAHISSASYSVCNLCFNYAGRHLPHHNAKGSHSFIVNSIGANGKWLVLK